MAEIFNTAGNPSPSGHPDSFLLYRCVAEIRRAVGAGVYGAVAVVRLALRKTLKMMPLTSPGQLGVSQPHAFNGYLLVRLPDAGASAVNMVLASAVLGI